MSGCRYWRSTCTHRAMRVTCIRQAGKIDREIRTHTRIRFLVIFDEFVFGRRNNQNRKHDACVRVSISRYKIYRTTTSTHRTSRTVCVSVCALAARPLFVYARPQKQQQTIPHKSLAVKSTLMLLLLFWFSSLRPSNACTYDRTTETNK